MKQTVILGNEYDQPLFAALKHVLAAQEATLLDESWEVAGSQEVSTYEVLIRGRRLIIEAETWIGLSISGPVELVAEITTAVVERTKAEEQIDR